MPVKVGVIGVGYLGRHHARIYAGLPDAELVGVADTDTAQAGKIASEHGTRAYADYRELIPLVDALSIATPTVCHRDIALECIKAGKDLLIEKPITAAVAEADEVIAEAKKRKLIIQVGHLERYNPAVVKLASLLKRPMFFESERVSPFLGRATDVDVTLDLMIHDIDIITGMLGGPSVKSFSVAGGSVITEKVDFAKAWLEFEGGAKAIVTASRVEREKRRYLKVFDSGSFYELDYQNMKIIRRFRDGENMGAEEMTIESREPLKEELIDFLRCVAKREKPLVSGAEGREALRIAIEITSKINQGRN